MYHFQKKNRRNNGLGMRRIRFQQHQQQYSRVYKQPFVMRKGEILDFKESLLERKRGKKVVFERTPTNYVGE